MNLNTILIKAWQTLWHYRSLWLFGAILALVGVNVIFPIDWLDWENSEQWTRIKINEVTTIQVPGGDITIDFTAPKGERILLPDGASWEELGHLIEEINREASINLGPILAEIALILTSLIVLGTIARYVAETAVIRMVNEAEETGKYLSVWEGLRKGFSIRACRLFLLDLLISILGVGAFSVIFGSAVAYSLLAIGRHEVGLITAGVTTMSLLIIAVYLWIAASAILSLLLQPIRRFCVLEEQSLFTSIRQGIGLTKQHLKDISPVWLVWVSLRMLWLPLGASIIILLVPILFITTLLGVGLGGVPAALTVLITGYFMDGATPWIMGTLAGLPFFIVVAISPILLISGLVEIYKSCIWTLAYRDLRKLEHRVPMLSPFAEGVVTDGAVD